MNRRSAAAKNEVKQKNKEQRQSENRGLPQSSLKRERSNLKTDNFVFLTPPAVARPLLQKGTHALFNCFK